MSIDKNKYGPAVTEALQREKEFFRSAFEPITDPVLAVLQAHLYTEQLLERIISAVLQKPDPILNKGRLTCYQKLVLVDSFGVVDKQIIDALKKLNGVRNDCAHKFAYELSEEDVLLIGRPLGKGFSRIKNELPEGPGAWLGALLPYLCGKLGAYPIILQNGT